MASIAPLFGIRYNPEKITELADVVTPPYDVISPEQQQAYFDRHENNIIRLILNPAQDGDTPESNPHTRAAAFFRQWLSQGVFQADDAPSMYLTTHAFDAPQGRVVRYGLIAAVKLEHFDSGSIKPHEKTFSKVKDERLSLMQNAHANFSPIFGLFPDPGGEILKQMKQAAQVKPLVSLVDENNQEHQLWQITDTDLQQSLIQGMENREFFIADGHHRYETALNYLAWRQSQPEGLPAGHPAERILMYLCSMRDPGLVILPAHRMLSRLSPEAIQALSDKAPDFFHIQDYDWTPEGGLDPEMLQRLEDSSGPAPIAVILPGGPCRLLTVKEGVMEKHFGKEMAPALLKLDVTVLTRLLFMDILGLNLQDLDDATLLSYTTKPAEVAQKVREGKVAAGFCIRPTQIEDVREVADSGEVMPRKSTYFYPKAITGLVLNDLK